MLGFIETHYSSERILEVDNLPRYFTDIYIVDEYRSLLDLVDAKKAMEKRVLYTIYSQVFCRIVIS